MASVNGNHLLTTRQRASLLRDAAPSVSQSSSSFVQWENVSELLGQPFDVTKIPLSKLYQMRRDPMIAFGLLFLKVPIVRAQWNIECKDARVAAFVDNALRAIYGRFVFQYMNSLDFGFSPIVKRFEAVRPDWTYQDPDDPTKERKVWDNGSVDAIVWKPFVALPPDEAHPWWDKNGDFGGITFKPNKIPNYRQTAFPQEPATNDRPDIDLDKALWATNEKDSVFGSLWGYPRVAYAYRFWWSYWYRWALADRHFEKDADPPCVVYFPPYTMDQDGTPVANQQAALTLGQQLRSGSTVALPSDLVLGEDDRPTNQRQWEVSYLKDGGNFNAFHESFTYLDVAKLRAVMVPEQALLEGSGGTSSRNVAAQLGDVFFESQAILNAEIDDHLNRFVIPQLVEANFGPGYTARKVTKGFASADMELSRAIIQMFGQADPTTLEVDLREMLRQANVPLLTPQQVALEEEKAAQEAAAQQAQQTPARSGYAGVNQWGQYYDDRPVIDLGMSAPSWIPDTPQFEDEEVVSEADRFRAAWVEFYTSDYESIANRLESMSLSDGLDMADKPDVDKLLGDWLETPDEVAAKADRVAGFVRSIMDAAGRKELAKLKVDDVQWDMERPDVIEFSKKHAAELVRNVGKTTRNELRRFLSRELDKTQDLKQLAQAVRERFPKKFPGWKADRLARTEAMLAYNNAALLAYKAAGLTHVQAHDAAIPERSDPDCIARDKKIYTIEAAFREQAKEHPNGTLSWSPPPTVRRKKRVIDRIRSGDIDLDLVMTDDLVKIDGTPTSALFDSTEKALYFDSSLTTEEADRLFLAFHERMADELHLGPLSKLKRAWDESKIRRGMGGRFADKPDVAPAPKMPTNKREFTQQLAKPSKPKAASSTAKGEKPLPPGAVKWSPGGRPMGEAAARFYSKFPDTQMMYSYERVVGPDDKRKRYYVPERAAMHDQIIDSLLRRRKEVVDDKGNVKYEIDPEGEYITPSGGKPKAIFTAGGSGTGKSTVLGANRSLDSVLIDPDEIKTLLPEYQDLQQQSDLYAAAGVHEESSDLAARLRAEAVALGLDVFIDGTGDSKEGKFANKVKEALSEGYDVDVGYVTVPTEVALDRVLKRAQRTGRYVPEEDVRDLHAQVSARFPEVAAIPEAQVTVYSTDVKQGDPPLLVAYSRAGSAEMTVADPDTYHAFLAKASEQEGGLN